MNYRLHQRVQLGVEVNPVVEEIGPLLNLFLVTETEARPAVFLGTSSDRIGSPAGTQSYYLTAAKYLSPIPVSLYASLNYSEWDAGVNFPFGGNLEFGKGISARYMFDGDRSHLMMNYFREQVGISLMYVWLDSFGVALSAGL